MSQIACPHCGTVNAAASAFCESCGKALPIANEGPRIVEGASLARTQAGRELQAQELAKKARSAAGALIAVAILMTLGGFLVPFLIDSEADKYRQRGMTIDQAKLDQIKFVARVTNFALAGAFLALFFWARKSPFPAAIVGLVLYVTLWIVDIVADPTSIARGILVRIIIIAVLVKAIQAGAQYRKLREEGAAAM